MKVFFKLVLVTLLVTPMFCFAAPLNYCTHNGEQPANATENALLQKLIPYFAKTMQCDIGNNCVGKWNNQDNPTKYSIGWAHQCGPVIMGQHQLGDDGHGSTFFCQKNPQTGKTCCAPLGYDYAAQFVVCDK